MCQKYEKTCQNSDKTSLRSKLGEHNQKSDTTKHLLLCDVAVNVPLEGILAFPEPRVIYP